MQRGLVLATNLISDAFFFVSRLYLGACGNDDVSDSMRCIAEMAMLAGMYGDTYVHFLKLHALVREVHPRRGSWEHVGCDLRYT